jgi:hypothetical protein
MRNWLSNWKRRRELDVEAELRASRPEASARFVKSVAARVNPRPVHPVRTRTRWGLAAAMTATMVAVVGATGGFSSAASSVLGATRSVTHIAVKPAPRVVHTSSSSGKTSGSDQYGAAPTISSFSPGSGPVGSTVTVNGSNYNGINQITSVTLHGVSVPNFNVISNTQLVFTVPSGATTGPIAVTNSTNTATTSSSFTVLVAPTLTSANPNSGGAGTVVQIAGQHLATVTSVTFGGVASTDVMPVSDTEVDAAVPVKAKVGSAPISVTTSAGQSTNTVPFTVESGAPVVSSFDKPSGTAGTVVTITGKNFDSKDHSLKVTEVDFGAGADNNPTVVSPTKVTATVPANATSGPITVYNASGSGTSSKSFLVIATPSVSSFTPQAAKAGDMVTITGSSFTGATEVDFGNGAVTKLTIKGDTSISAKVPSNASTGVITVKRGSVSGHSAGTFTFLTQAPTVASASPSSAGAGSAITIGGSNFIGANAVTINGKPASFSVTDATHIAAIVPTGADKGKGGIVVANSVGKSAAFTGFTVLSTSPTITKVTDNGSKPKPVTAAAVGDTIVISGTNLDKVLHVSFGGTTQSTFVSQSATQLKVAVPTGAETGALTLDSGVNGQATAKGTFTILAAPVVLGVSPAYGKAGATITIVGSNLAGANDVAFRTNSGTVGHATPKLNSDGSLSVNAPKALVALTHYELVVSVPTLSGGTLTGASGNNTFTVVNTPKATGGPTTGSPNASITITGSGFTGTTSVMIGKTSLGYHVSSDGSISVTLPATTGKNQVITITNPAGKATWKITIQ